MMSLDTTSPKRTTRVFRADSPTDVVSAAIVAKTLPPGRDVLALCSEKAKAFGAIDGYAECIQALSRLHTWQSVVDIADGHLHELWSEELSRRDRLKNTLGLLKVSRSQLATALGLQPDAADLKEAVDHEVDEVYLTVIHHPDMQLLYKICPSAKKIYYPHSFDSLGKVEIAYYSPFFSAGAAPKVSLTSRIADKLKRVIWGDDAVPGRLFTLDAGYTYKLPLPWAAEQHSLASTMDKQLMNQLFRRLPPEVQDYYSGLVTRCGGAAGVFCMSSQDEGPEYPYDIELDCYVCLARQMTEEQGIKALLLKPHPLIRRAWVDRVVQHLGEQIPNLRVVVIEDYTHFPVEIVLAPFSLSACATVVSSAVHTLRRIYDLPSYCSEPHLRRLWARTPQQQQVVSEFISDLRGHQPVPCLSGN